MSDNKSINKKSTTYKGVVNVDSFQIRKKEYFRGQKFETKCLSTFNALKSKKRIK